MAKTTTRRKKAVSKRAPKIVEPTLEPESPEPSDNEIEPKAQTTFTEAETETAEPSDNEIEPKSRVTFAEMVFMAILAVIKSTERETFTYQSIEKYMDNKEGQVQKKHENGRKMSLDLMYFVTKFSVMRGHQNLHRK